MTIETEIEDLMKKIKISKDDTDRKGAAMSMSKMLEALPPLSPLNVETDDEGDIHSETQIQVVHRTIVKGSGTYTNIRTRRVVYTCSVFIYLFDPTLELHKYIGVDPDTIIFIEEFKCNDDKYGKILLSKVLTYIKDKMRNKRGQEFTYVTFDEQENLKKLGAKYTGRGGSRRFGYVRLEEIIRACLFGVRERSPVSPVFSSDSEEDNPLYSDFDNKSSNGGKKNHTNRKYTMKSRKNKKSKKKWSLKYKKSINCKRPRGFSQRQYCKYGRKNLK